jgi:hypothetical protein
VTEAEERDRKARIRSCSVIAQRASRATGAVAVAMQQEAIEIDRMGEQVAIGSYEEAEEHLENALGLVRDCLRSIKKGTDEGDS